MYLYLGIALAAALAGGAASWQIQNWRHDAAEKERAEMLAKEQARKADRIDQAAVAHEKDKRRIETKYLVVTKEVEREIEKPVYRDVCLPPDGVRIVNELIQGTPAGEPASGVSGPAPAR